jgi:hypothetical protein
MYKNLAKKMAKIAKVQARERGRIWREKERKRNLLKLVPSNEAVTVQIKPSKSCLNLQRSIILK